MESYNGMLLHPTYTFYFLYKMLYTIKQLQFFAKTKDINSGEFNAIHV